MKLLKLFLPKEKQQTVSELSGSNTNALMIPKDNAQVVQVLKSYTVRWQVQANGYMSRDTYHKVFIKTEDVKEFKKQLKHSADFIGASIWIEDYEN
jgi:hypothetical protein